MKTAYRVTTYWGRPSAIGEQEKVIFPFKNIFIQGEILYFSSSISTGIKSWLIWFGGNPTELNGNQSRFYHSEKPPKKALQAIFNKLFRAMQIYR